MSKRKRETANEESATREQSKKVKKQKTSTTRAPQAKAPSTAAPTYTETEGSAPVPSDRTYAKLAGKLARREKEALQKPQRDESGRKDGIKTGEGDEDTELVEFRERKSLENGKSAASKNQHESQERGKEGGQVLTGEHKSKKDKPKDRTVRPNGKKNKGKAVETATWKVSDSLGGQMLDVDPVFSPDEK